MIIGDGLRIRGRTVTKRQCCKLLDRAHSRMANAENSDAFADSVAYNTKLIATIQERFPLWFEDWQIEKSMK